MKDVEGKFGRWWKTFMGYFCSHNCLVLLNPQYCLEFFFPFNFLIENLELHSGYSVILFPFIHATNI